MYTYWKSNLKFCYIHPSSKVYYHISISLDVDAYSEELESNSYSILDFSKKKFSRSSPVFPKFKYIIIYQIHVYSLFLPYIVYITYYKTFMKREKQPMNIYSRNNHRRVSRFLSLDWAMKQAMVWFNVSSNSLSLLQGRIMQKPWSWECRHQIWHQLHSRKRQWKQWAFYSTSQSLSCPMF